MSSSKGHRMIGVAMDFSETSEHALSWAFTNLIREDDHVVLIPVLEKNDINTYHADLWKDDGSPLIPFVEFKEVKVLENYGLKPNSKIFQLLEAANKQRKVVIVAKVYWGDAREKLIKSVKQLKLNCLVMGSRGLGSIKGALLGSVSTHLVTNADCPVTVVKLPMSS